jgi:PmbA protein
MQRDGYYTVARDSTDLERLAYVAQQAGERTVQRLGARRLKTCNAPVIFHADIATGLFGSFLSAISGGNLYRKASFLLDHLGKNIFADHITLIEKPHLLKGLASAPFDAEGVATHERNLVTDGVLQGYLLSSYSARKLGMQSTGNAGGAHNIFINTSEFDLQALLKEMNTGLLVTEVMGQGVNIVTGDYSRGASGFWVENGIIQYPVEEITIAGNLRDMFKHIVTIGNDINKHSSIHTGSILIDRMMIAGE